MGKQTSVQWAFSSLNLQAGCDGCELWNSIRRSCYAGKQIDGAGGRPGFRGQKGWPSSFAEPKLFLERLDEGLKWGPPTEKERDAKPWFPRDYPRVIFLNDMGDTFSKKLPLNWMAPLLPRIAESPHQWMLLTKRPSLMLEFSRSYPLPPNVWPGTTITSQATVGRLDPLAAVRGGGPKFVSLEPLLGPVQFYKMPAAKLLDLVIIGGESGTGTDPLDFARECDTTWILDAMNQADELEASVFVKQLGSNVRHLSGIKMLFDDSHGGNWNEWPGAAFRRREMPAMAVLEQFLI